VVAWGDVPTWVAVSGALLGSGAALWQLRLQRIQFADQTRLQERRQADAIDVRVGGAEGGQLGVLPPDESQPVHAIIVSNNSHRPIREVACSIEAIHCDGTTRHNKLADVYGMAEALALGPGAQAETFVVEAHASTKPVLRAGTRAWFAWNFPAADYPRLLSWVRFTDDAGLHWEITTDLHLKKLPKRDW
jgi:hypothetical protein